MKYRSLPLVIIFLLTTFFSHAQQVYYTSNNGSSGNDGSSFNNAVDLQTALARVSAGDTILMKEGVYSVPYSSGETNTFLLTKSGTEQRPIVITSEPGKKTTIDFSFPEGQWVQDSTTPVNLLFLTVPVTITAIIMALEMT